MKPTVLLVDDDVQLLGAVAHTLQALPVNVETRRSAELALQWLESGGAPTLIISNQWMSGMTGQALFDWVREHRPQVRCVLHTGDIAQRGDGHVTVITKPAPAGLLQNLVSAACR